MKQRFSLVSIMTFLSVTILLLSSCQTIGGLMKTSFWAGAIFVIVIIALIIFVIARMGKKN